MLLEKNGVLGVGAKSSIGDVAHEWHQANDEIDNDVEHHLGFD